MKKNFFCLCAFFLLLNSNIKAQITIGMDASPMSGALLQLKDTDVSDGNANATRGLVMPRVKLTDKNKLQPMYSYADAANTPSVGDLEAHAGLSIYHVSGVNPKECASIPDGIYVWDGTEWQSISQKKASTMQEYKDLWEERYGLLPGDEPNSDGNVALNTHRVQWHRDQSGNIFFSAMFDNERWMITNLAATEYDTDAPIKPALTNAYGASGWVYPNLSTSSIGDDTEYKKKGGIGLLYGWTAASGNENNDGIDQAGIVHGPYQGICPNSWHLPTNLEWATLLEHFKVKPAEYSGNTDAKTGYTMKGLCEKTMGTGKSFNILDGGFNLLLAGFVSGESTFFYGGRSYVWSASMADAKSARYLYLSDSATDVSNVPKAPVKSSMLSVRCKK